MGKSFAEKIMPFAGILILLAVIGIGLAIAFPGNNSAPKEGESAPDFSLPSVNGETFSLSDFKGKKNVLLFFQEGIMCPPCWQQQVDLELKKADLDALNVEPVMITVDPPAALAQAKAQYGITSTVLYDNDLKVSRQYDVLTDSMHPGERPGHVFVLVDKEGKIRWYYSAYKPSGNSGHHSGGGTMYVPVGTVLNSIQSALST